MLMLPGILFIQFCMSFLMVQRAPITTGNVVVLSPLIRSTSISKSLYLLSFFVVLTGVLVSRGIVVSMRKQVLSFLLFSKMSGQLAAMVLSVWMGMSHRMMTLSFQVTVLGIYSCDRSFTSIPSSLQIFQCMCACVCVCVHVLLLLLLLLLLSILLLLLYYLFHELYTEKNKETRNTSATFFSNRDLE